MYEASCLVASCPLGVFFSLPGFVQVFLRNVCLLSLRIQITSSEFSQRNYWVCTDPVWFKTLDKFRCRYMKLKTKHSTHGHRIVFHISFQLSSIWWQCIAVLQTVEVLAPGKIWKEFKWRTRKTTETSGLIKTAISIEFYYRKVKKFDEKARRIRIKE